MVGNTQDKVILNLQPIIVYSFNAVSGDFVSDIESINVRKKQEIKNPETKNLHFRLFCILEYTRSSVAKCLIFIAIL